MNTPETPVERPRSADQAVEAERARRDFLVMLSTPQEPAHPLDLSQQWPEPWIAPPPGSERA